MTNKIIPALMALLMLGMVIAPVNAASPASNSGNSDIHVTKMIVEPSGPDLNFTIYYQSNFFTRVFSLFFGARVLQPSIEHVFSNFTNVTVISIDSNNGNAKVIAKNQSMLADGGWYVYDGTKVFTSNISIIEVHTSDGNIETFYDTNQLPVISNRMPLINKTN